MKFLNRLLYIIAIIVCSVTLILIALVNIDFFNSHKLSFSISGIETYFNLYGQYGGLFAMTITSIVATVGIESLNQSIKANNERLKQDRFTEWKNALELRIKEMADKNPSLNHVFTKVRYSLFSILFDFNFKIENKAQLSKLLEPIKTSIRLLEENNDNYIE